MCLLGPGSTGHVASSKRFVWQQFGSLWKKLLVEHEVVGGAGLDEGAAKDIKTG